MSVFRSRCVYRSLGLLCVVLLSSGLPAQGQTLGAGQIEGVIMDPSGAVIPGAKVVVREVATGAERELTTNEVGRYRAVNLRPGEYEVTAEAPGFATIKREGISVEVGFSATVNITLQVAATAEVVTVTEDAPVTRPDSTESATVISQNAVTNLPMVGRQWTNFVLLTPGTDLDGNFGLISYRGITGLLNNNMVDGADNNQAFFSEARGRTRLPYTLSQNSIKEFQVGNNNFSAEVGRVVGGTVNAVTKSGSNAFHGDAFYFIRDEAFIARGAIDKSEGREQLQERRQQFGFSVGGPVKQDKLFWFLNYDQQIRNFPGLVVNEGSVRVHPDEQPTSKPLAACEAGSATNPIDPARCAAARDLLFSRLGPHSRKGLNEVALGKLDWNISQNHTLTTQYNYGQWRSPSGIQTQDRHNDTPLANGFDGVRTDFFLTRFQSILTPTLINEFRFQYGRDFESQLPGGPGPMNDFRGELDIDDQMREFLPRPAFPDEDRYQFIDNITWVRGTHTFKAGADINRVRDLQVNLRFAGGQYDYRTFLNWARDVPLPGIPVDPDEANPARTGKHYRDFDQAFDLTGENGRVVVETTDWNFYFQDTWKLHPHLTLNYGIRYEYTDIPQPDSSLFSGPLVTPLWLTLPASIQQQLQSFNKDTNNWGPRVAIAWDIGGRGKTVLRSGYGLVHARTPNNIWADAVVNNGISRLNAFQITPTNPISLVYPNTFCDPPVGTPGQESVCTPPPAFGSSVVKLVDPDYVVPLVHTAELEIEQSLSPNMSVSATYMLSRGQRLPMVTDINLPAPSSTIEAVIIDDASGSELVRLPFYTGARPIAGFGTLIQTSSVVNSWYHAGVFRFKRRMSQGLQFDAHFTWAKAIDNGQNSNQEISDFAQYVDPQNQRLDRSVSDFDVRRRFVGNFVWEAPYQNIDNSALRKIVEGFIFSGVLTLRSGNARTADLDFFAPGAFGATSPFTPNGAGTDDRAPWLSRNSFRTRDFANFDFRVTREFRFGETMKAIFIWEAFNIFNHVNYAYSPFGTDGFDTVSTAVVGDERRVFVEPSDRDAPLAGEFPQPTGNSTTLWGPREMQFAFKFIW